MYQSVFWTRLNKFYFSLTLSDESLDPEGWRPSSWSRRRAARWWSGGRAPCGTRRRWVTSYKVWPWHGARESAVETISTRKGVSNHAQVQSNVGKKRAMIKDHPPSEGVCGSACFIRLGHLKKPLRWRCPKTNSYIFKKLDPDETLVLSSVWSGCLVPLRTIIFPGTAPQSGPRHSKETRSSRLCLQISTSLCVPLCPDLSRQRSPLIVNLKLLLSIRDIIAPPSITWSYV